MSYIGDEKLLEAIRKIRQAVQADTFDEEMKQGIYETVTAYLNGYHNIDPVAVQYLCTGFIFHRILGMKSVIPLDSSETEDVENGG